MKRLSEWSGGRAAAKTACFLLLLALVLGRANAVLVPKDGMGYVNMHHLYGQEEESIDVLILGSSIAFMNISTGTLWREYGVPAYALGGGAQPIWNTYYYLKEALKTQRPRLLVLDTFMLNFSGEYGDGGGIVLNTSGMKWSRDKVRAIQASAPPEERARFLLTYCQYHARFRDVSREDFMDNKGDEAKYGSWKGSYLLNYVTESPWPKDFQTEERAALGAKVEDWYRRIIELAQSSGIPLLIVADPTPDVTAQRQAVYNTASDIAGEYGVSFLNFHEDFGAIGVDPKADFADGRHMNIWGAEKFTRFLGAYLKDHYDLPDRRGDPAYQSWEDNAQYLEAASRDGRLALGVTPEEAASLLRDPDYTCAVSTAGNGGTAYAPLLEALGVPAGEAGAWLVSGGEVLWASGPAGEEYFPLDTHDLKLTASPSGTGMVFDREALETVPNGVSILVYDAVTQARAAFLTFGVSGSG